MKPSWIALITYQLALVGSAGLSSISTFSVSHVLDFFSCHNNCSVQLFSHVRLYVTPWTAARQASLFITNSLSLLKLMSIDLVMPSNHLILCHPLFLLPSILPSLRVFSNESVHRIRWPKNWSFSFSISPSNEYSGLIFFRIDSRAQESGTQGTFPETVRPGLKTLLCHLLADNIFSVSAASSAKWES